jgi:hypothetical protein
MTIDSAGNAYIAGASRLTFPVTPGAFQTSSSGSPAVVAKLNPAGSNLVYATFLNGPAGSTDVYAVAVNQTGEAFVTGMTAGNFPTTPGAFNTTLGSSIFLTRLNAAGSGLVYSTYVGSGYSLGIAVDATNSAYITGFASCGPYGVPTTSGAFETSGGFSFVTKVKPDGSGLVYSSCLGSIVAGQGALYSFAIAVDAAGEAFAKPEGPAHCR